METADERARTVEEQASTVNQQMLEMQVYIQRRDAVLLEQLEMLRALKEVINRFIPLTESGGIVPVLGPYDEYNIFFL